MTDFTGVGDNHSKPQGNRSPSPAQADLVDAEDMLLYFTLIVWPLYLV